MELCEQATDEQDAKKLAAMILQINFILEAKELRLAGKVPTMQPAVEAEYCKSSPLTSLTSLVRVNQVQDRDLR